MDFNYNVGYSGLVQINDKKVLATGGNVSISSQPIYTTGVWGAGWQTASDKIAFAPNYVTLQASINYQLTKTAIDQIQSFAFSDRYNGKKFKIYPNGKAGYTGKAFCSGCGFSASQDSLVTGDLNLKTADVSASASIVTASISSDTTGLILNTTDFGTSYTTEVFPFWASKVSITTSVPGSRITSFPTSLTDMQTTDWNASYSADVTFVMTCCGNKEASLSATGGVFSAKYYTLGVMDATGSFTTLGIPEELSPINIRKVGSCEMKISTTDNGTSKFLKFYSIALQSGSTDVQNGNNIITAQFNITAIGNGTNYPLQFS